MARAKAVATTDHADNPEIVLRPGNPLVLNPDGNGRELSGRFLGDFVKHYNAEGFGIFTKIYREFPTHYWAGLIQLAKVLKIEIGSPHEFERPSTREEALDRLERQAGPEARAAFEKFLRNAEGLEQRYLEAKRDDE